MNVRECVSDDVSAVRRCIVELQEFERALDPRLRPGETMADEYWQWIRTRCAEANGRVFVAERDGSVVGFVSVLAAQPFTELDEPPGHYALVTDLVVLSVHRGLGIGRELMRAAEEFVRFTGARELRVGVLAANSVARRLYLDSGFMPYLEIFSKRWDKPAV